LNKIVSIKNANAIFLATVLVAGIIALSSPSFMVGAQAVPQYGIENGYGSYEPEPEYQQQYTDREYNNYPSEYEMDSYETPSYGNNNYEPREYPSYKPDYKPEYPSDNNYKSKKDSSNSVSLNKLNCVDNNVNINGNNTGDINVGNSGKSATGSGTDEGYLGVGSVGGNGEGYDNGYKKQKDQGFTCIINNNNNNTVVVGEEPVPPVEECAETDEIEACFEQFLTDEEFPRLIAALESGITIGINGEEVTLRSFNEICLAFEGLTTYLDLNEAIDNILNDADISPGEDITAIVDCIAQAIGIPPTPP
jgi:hypothetical protein